MTSRLIRTATSASLGLFALLALGARASTLAAQPGGTAKPAKQKVKLSAVIGAFLVDSGVRTRGLPWTTGSELPIKWESGKPVPSPEYLRRDGFTLVRSGTFTGTVGDSVAVEMTLTLSGSETGLGQVAVSMASMEVTTKKGSGFFLNRQMVEKALKDEGVTFQPLKCSREKEGASSGNLVDAVKVPGKTASGLWWLWDSPQQSPNLALTILYRRTDMAKVECNSG